jgi:class 3 adenylate cyclase
MQQIATRSKLPPEALTMRFGLHWGPDPYVGLISTVGRTEITALGDDVNDAARIEACATGGRVLASKHLIERLGPDRAGDLDLGGITCTQLGELTTATARRDAPSIAVCAL